MTVPNGYLQEHTQTYFGTNPSPYGALTWRMTMIPGVEEEPDGITSIYTILPIDSREDATDEVTLFFNIKALPDAMRFSRRATGLREARFSLGLRLPNKRDINIRSITGVPPVATAQSASYVAIYFDINSLPTLTRRKNRFSVKANVYNSRSIDKLSAEKPLFVSGTDNAVVTFDIQSLDPA